ncbi:hypothetical protein [Rhodoferax sp.]|jgi:hypothetical protein|uniref:hypothetical protein n=1 Tax=Rhodoferax sp. TaxID=50421 RepID=UPI00271CE290|nr:hypothetical protein [Rhodoferax sp.]MDO9142986.1 hypothetical protein [Rhodoferax sp.]MDP1530170.1 hypothetical protein [Rhodoferax sp.]MDP1945428.1 hypothetical protein [Rhodoferax sp.]MDP2443196.1 hypothetical protein [Rhodoferax sp.]MDP3190859.1 hypothetical protein [Rhodoferax sp.]
MRLAYLSVLLATAPGVSVSAPAQTAPASRLASIQVSKLVRVCLWPDCYSITYRNPKTHTLSGVDIEMAHRSQNLDGHTDPGVVDDRRPFAIGRWSC